MRELFEQVKGILHSDMAALKLFVVRYGLAVDGRELEGSIPGYPEDYRTKRSKKSIGLLDGELVDRETEDHPWIPEEIYIKHGSVRSVVKTNFVEDSPFRLTVRGKEAVVVAEDLGLELDCDLPRRRSVHDTIINGYPADNFVQVIGSDRVAILGYDGCHGWFTGKQCKFCDSCASRPGETFGRPSLNDLRNRYSDDIDRWMAECQPAYFEGLLQAYRLILADKIGPHFHLHLMAGNLPDVDREWRYMLELIEALNTVRPLEAVPDSYLNILPPHDDAYMEKAHRSGCRKLIFNLEVYREERFAAVCPDKNELMPYDDFVRKMKDAVRIFGWGNVRCGFVLGAQPVEELKRGVVELAEHGIAADYTVFTPKKGTPWKDRERPDIVSVARFAAFLTQIYRGYGLEPLFCRESARNSCANEILDDLNLWIDNEPRMKEAVDNAAHKIKTFKLKGRGLGFSGARERVRGWVGNFYGLLGERNPLPAILGKLAFLSDDYILSQCQEYLEDPEHSGSIPDRRIHYTCFGESSESSARIISPLNNQPNYSANLPQLLDRLADRLEEKPVIVFFDDFINTAGQFLRILGSWCGQNYDDERTVLSLSQREVFKRCELLFVFCYGVEKARERAHRCLEELGLNGRIVILHQYIDEKGIFGTRDDMQQIECGLPARQEHPEGNLSYGELRDFLSVCKQAGTALLRLYKPKWSDEGKEAYYTERALGYGNSAKMFVGQTNIPTCTLTCLWIGGLIEINGETRFWLPLIDRIEKSLGGSEKYRPVRLRPPVSDKPEDLIAGMSAAALDYERKQSNALEIILFAPIPVSRAGLQECSWRDETGSYIESADLRQFLAWAPDGQNPDQTRIYELAPDVYQQVNDHLRYELEGRPYGIRLRQVHLATFGGLISFLGIRFSISPVGKQGSIDITSALKIIFNLPLVKNTDAGFILKGVDTPVPAGKLFSIFYEFVTAGKAIKRPFTADGPSAEEFARERFYAMCFMREGTGIFTENLGLREAVFQLAATFSRPKADYLASRTNFERVELEDEAVLSASHKGSVAFCSRANVNRTGLPNRFLKEYYFLYLLALHLNELTREYRLNRDDDRLRSDAIAGWLTRFRTFPYDNASSHRFQNLYLQALNRVFSLEEAVQTAVTG